MDTASGEDEPKPQQAPPAQEPPPAKELLLSVAATPSQETDSTMSIDVSFGGPALVSNISLDSLDGARSFAPASGEPSERGNALPAAGAVLSGRDSPRAKQPNETATTSSGTHESLGSGSSSPAGATGAAEQGPEAHEEVRGAHEEVRYLHGAHFLHFDSQEEEPEGQVKPEDREKAKQEAAPQQEQDSKSRGELELEVEEEEQEQEQEDQLEPTQQEQFSKAHGQVDPGQFDQRKQEPESTSRADLEQDHLEPTEQEPFSKAHGLVDAGQFDQRKQEPESTSRADLEQDHLEHTEQEQFSKAHGQVDPGQFDQRKQEQDANAPGVMEFTKDYSDDLMGSLELQRAATGGGPDLADFELPPYSGSSSSGSEQPAAPTKQSPVKQRKSSNSMAATQVLASSSYAAGSDASAAAPDLSAVKNIIMSTYSNVSHLFHWKRPIETGLIFSIGFTLIIALTFFSIISVVAYTALGIILASAMLRLYKTSMKALNRSSETPVDHIWEMVLDANVSLSPERLHELVDSSHANLNASLVYFKQVLLVEDKFATTKFFLFLYSLTYIGSWFNGLTLITIIYVSLFSVPLVYENHQDKIDQYLNLFTSQISSAVSLMTSKLGCCGGASKKQN